MAVGDDLKSIKTLLSPCDPASKKQNQDWYLRETTLVSFPAPYSVAANRDRGLFAGRNLVENYAQSYSVHKGASVGSGETIMATTKNILGADSRDNKGGLAPVQTVDIDGDGKLNDASGSWNWNANRSKRKDSSYRNGNGRHYHSNTMDIGNAVYSGWDDYLCAGHTAGGLSAQDTAYQGSEYAANNWIGANVDIDLSYQRDNNERNVLRSLAMAGLGGDSGNILNSTGNVRMANDSQLKAAIQDHRDAEGITHFLPVNCLTSATRDMAK